MFEIIVVLLLAVIAGLLFRSSRAAYRDPRTPDQIAEDRQFEREMREIQIREARDRQEQAHSQAQIDWLEAARLGRVLAKQGIVERTERGYRVSQPKAKKAAKKR